MQTIGDLVKQFEISRTTLLYYDRIDLLKPSVRSEAGYRLYSESDIERMKTIKTYRDAGLSLEDIKNCLPLNEDEHIRTLEKHLSTLNKEINQLHSRQQMILALLKKQGLEKNTRVLNKAQWIEILRASGMSEEDMLRWHQEFEASAPEAHQDFLEALGIPVDEIERIRKR